MLRLRPYKPGDEEDLAPRLKPIDVYEVVCASGMEPIDALRLSVQDNLELHTLELDGSIMGLAGVSVLDQYWHTVWLLTDERLNQCMKTFLKLSREISTKWVNRYVHLCNWVALKNETSRRWLRYIGFSEGSVDHNFMGSGEPFVFIYRSYQ